MNKGQFQFVTHWQRETFPKATALSMIAHLRQELDELVTAIEMDTAVPHEFADCFMLLYGAADRAGLRHHNIVAAIDDKMAINRLRKWGEPDENGVVNHIKTALLEVPEGVKVIVGVVTMTNTLLKAWRRGPYNKFPDGCQFVLLTDIHDIRGRHFHFVERGPRADDVDPTVYTEAVKRIIPMFETII